MNLRELAWLRECDSVADYFALVGQFAPQSQIDNDLRRAFWRIENGREIPVQVTPWHRYVAELGVREGRHMREHGEAAGAAA